MGYPLYIKIFIGVMGLLLFIGLPVFIIYELPSHLKLADRLKQAHALMDQGRCAKAIVEYSTLETEYPTMREARLGVVKCSFVLSAENADYYTWGMENLAHVSDLKEKDMRELETYVPEVFKEDFLNSFRID